MLKEAFSWIILIASVISAITAIVAFVRKPRQALEQKQQEKTRQQIIELLDSLMPQYLEPHDEIFEEIRKELEEIKTINETQNATMELLKSNLQDVLRQQIEEIYDIYEEERALPSYVREKLDELYSGYKAANGNHHIDKLYKRMCSWPTYEEKSKYDLD